jgi:hypothetical protein
MEDRQTLEPAMDFLFFPLLVLVVPAGLYLFHGGGRSQVWGLVAAGQQAQGSGAYRQARSTLWKRGSAPISVRIAALSSFFLGQMILPGGLAALVGMVATLETIGKSHPSPLLIIIQLSSPTGLIVAAYLLSAGSAMISRAEDAVLKARRAARWALGHNLVLLVGLGVGAALEGSEAVWALAPAIYCCISIAQALLVRRAASSIEAYSAKQEEEPAPIETELDLLGIAR